MLEGLTLLLELQRLDTELIALEEEHAAIPTRRDGISAERTAADEKLVAAGQGLQDAEAGQRRAEQELQDQEALLQKLEGQQFQVKTNEAYTALLHEIEAARQGSSDCETRILECMEAIETSRTQHATADRDLRDARERLDAEEQALEAREKELSAQIGGLREQRAELTAGIPRDLMEQYQRIISRRRPAIIVVTKELCEGCRVDIPPQSFIEILRGERIIACGHCQRILIHRDKLAAPAAS